MPNPFMTTVLFKLSLLSCFLYPPLMGLSQIINPYASVLAEIENFESKKDPKCHATAARLEDFIYGTPLNVEARNQRIQFQQNFVYRIWKDYSNRLKIDQDKSQSLDIFKQVESTLLIYTETAEGIQVQLNNGAEHFITSRDFRQYSSIAYAYRAILSVQQSCLLSTEDLAPLEGDVLERLKKSVDIAVLTVLNRADQYARAENQYQISGEHLSKAVNEWELNKDDLAANAVVDNSISPADFIYPVVTQKLAAYKTYNQLNQAVFLRNVQVYFSKMPWPKDPVTSNQLKDYFTEIMVQFSAELLEQGQKIAQQKKNIRMGYQDVYEAVQLLLPHSINYFEDVNYFPRLDKNKNVVIQAYDLDAFRDSGLHWQYLKFAVDDNKETLILTPDPFALEMMVEGIAQFAVLLFRMSGSDALVNEDPILGVSNLNNALASYQLALRDYAALPPLKESSFMVDSAPKSDPINAEALFVENTQQINLNFEHRNSDWLSRLIRSYLIKEDENLARLAIPPAFGGAGVATEDIDNDGWVDVLLLSGKGNRLYKNNQGQNLVDITQQAGIEWQREDGKEGEARQPIIVDFDNDGWQDILIIYANDNHRIYKNIGNGQFQDMTEVALLGGEGLVAGPATVIDFDKDGLLDIYIGYFGNYVAGELPTLKRNNTNGTPNKLFKNLGGFTFQDVSNGSGVENQGWTQAVGHTDINRDGWQDLIAGNDFGTNAYYINNKNGTFSDYSQQMGTDKPSYTMNIGVGDPNGDLMPDFYISNIVVMEKDDKYVLPNEDTNVHFDPASLASMRVVEANDLFLSTPNTNELPVFQASKNVGRGYSSTGWSWDADFFDFDNDTDEDLYCLTGMNQYSVYGVENPYYTSPDGNAKAVTFANSKSEKNILFENKKGFLTVVEDNSGLDYSGTSRSAAYFDFDRDGDLDIIVNDYQGAARFFRNQANEGTNNWVTFRLKDLPESGNIDAIGASLVLTLPDGRKLWREIHSTSGYLSAHPKEVYFGLGANTNFSLTIHWPNGGKEIISDLMLNKQHILERNK